MSKNRTINTAKNIATGLIYRFVHILMPFVLRSVMIRVLGTEYLGLNTLFTSIFTFLNLAEFGFASAMTFRMYMPAKENNYALLSVYASVIRKVYKILGLVMLLLGAAIMPFLQYFIKGSHPQDVNIYLLYAIYLLNMVLPYLGAGYCVSIFTAFQRVDISNLINALFTFCMNVAQILVILLTKNYYWYIVCLPLFTAATNLAFWRTKKKKYSQICTNEQVNKDVLKSTFRSAGALFGHSLNYVVVSAADNIVISSFMGLAILAVYGNYYTIFSAVIGLLDIVMQSCTPSIGNLLTEANNEHELKIFKTISFLAYWASGWCAICLLCLYQPFMRIWMGDTMLLPFSSVLLFAIYLYSYKGRSAVLAFKDAAGLWQADWLKPYVSALVNIVLNVALVKVIGLNGVLISTIFVFFAINFPWETQVLLRRSFKKYRGRYYMDFAGCLVVNILAGIVTFLLCVTFRSSSNFLVLVYRAAICLVVPNVVWIAIFHKSKEFQSLLSKAKSLVSSRGE